MANLKLILLILAFVLVLLAAWDLKPPRINVHLGWLGLSIWILSLLIT
jgi:hypothetical protein